MSILVSDGVISQEQLSRALSESRVRHEDVGKTLVSMGYVSTEDVARARAKRLSLLYEDLDPRSIPPDILALLPEKVMRRCDALPLRLEEEKLVVAMSDPSNIYAVEDLRMISGRRISPVVATEESIRSALDSLFDREERVRSEVLEETEGEESEEAPFLQNVTEPSPDDAPIIRLFDSLLRRAIEQRASDIHIEPLPGRMTIRYRIDGV
ncbi:MAG: GspE/PulE family protein, partial [Rubrobacteraceae bacterium]